MAQVLTKVAAYGIEASEPLQKIFHQVLVLEGTGLAADVAYDLGNYTGTFWTAVGGTEPGTSALKAVKDIQIAAKALILVGGLGITGAKDVSVIAPAAATDVRVLANATNTLIPDITYFAANGVTSWKFVIKWVLKNGNGPIEVQVSA